MKIHIPIDGDKIKLTEDWTFTLDRIGYSGNENLINRSGLLQPGDNYWKFEPQLFTLPVGTILEIKKVEANPNRDIYIFQAKLIDCPISSLVRKPRATPVVTTTIEDANNIQFEEYHEQ